MQLNQVMLAGNLTRDPSPSVSGGPVKFSIASNRRWKSNGTEHEEVTFVDVEVWGDLAAMVVTLPKGFPVLVEARLKMDSWIDKESNAKRSRLVLVAHRVHWLRQRDAASGSSRAMDPAEPSGFKSAPAQMDEPPF